MRNTYFGAVQEIRHSRRRAIGSNRTVETRTSAVVRVVRSRQTLARRQSASLSRENERVTEHATFENVSEVAYRTVGAGRTDGSGNVIRRCRGRTATEADESGRTERSSAIHKGRETCQLTVLTARAL